MKTASNGVFKSLMVVASFALFSVASSLASADQPMAGQKPLVLTLQNHVFTPSEIHVPANRKFEIRVKNLDITPEEFDSDDLKVEKVIAGKSEGLVRIRALKAGRYRFEGEYHDDSAQGVVIAE